MAANPPTARRNPTWDLIHQFYGYLGMFIFTLYGKRTGTLTRMRIDDILDAKRDGLASRG